MNCAHNFMNLKEKNALNNCICFFLHVFIISYELAIKYCYLNIV